VEQLSEVIDRGNLVSAFFNSTLYAIIGTGLAVLMGAMAAFVLSRRKSRLTGAMYFYLVMGIVLRSTWRR
jgi:raffinose/stachyose/melibiose transport system permease protein